MKSIPLDHPLIAWRGAPELRRAGASVTPVRLGQAAAGQSADAFARVMSEMSSGVRIDLVTDARAVELDLEVQGFAFGDAAPRPAVIDLLIEDRLVARRRLEARGVLSYAADRGWSETPTTLETVRFETLPAGVNRLEAWLPQSARTTVQALRISPDADLHGRPGVRPLWAHYGSSISHGMASPGPSETWPALAARRAGVDLFNLGLAGQCHLDPFAARALAAAAPDVISLKVGVNIVNLDTFRERAFVPAAHGFLDLLRERRPETPILLATPVLCPAHETRPGPTVMTETGAAAVDRPLALAAGALGLARIRTLLERVVRQREDPRLVLIDGLALFGPGEEADLPDGLHPSPQGLARIAERFHRLGLGPVLGQVVSQGSRRTT